MPRTVCLVLIVLVARVFAQTPPVVLRHARIIDGTGGKPLEDASLVIVGDRIAGINVPAPKGAPIVDAQGKTIIPGLICAHGHLGVTEGTTSAPENYTRENVARQLRQYERYGVTAMVSLGLNRDLVYDLRQEQKEGKCDGSTIFTAGRGIGVPHGAPPLNVGADQVYRPATPEEARAAVREMAAHHPDLIKVWVDDIGGTMPKMQPEIYRAVIDESHKNHLRAAAHIYYLSDAKALVDAGVDVIAHSVRDRPVDAGFIGRMKARGVWYIPTLELDETFFVYADHPNWIQDPFLATALNPDLRAMFSSPDWRDKVERDPKTSKERQAFFIAEKNLRTLYTAGVKIAMGTDSGATPLRIQGFAEHLEMGLMGDAGMRPMDVLVAATRGGAAVAGTAGRGTLEPGHYADLVVLDSNPLDNIRNTQKLSAVWHNGKKIDRGP
jgi:imidazolonepropionase-like amidohydrolase